jgi:hypothetical protein
MRRVMTQINSRELPHELLDIEIATQVSKTHGALNELGQQAAPLSFHLEDLVSDPALDVIELEQAGRHWTSAGQSRTLRPSEPIANQHPQAGKAFCGLHRRLDYMRGGEFRHVRKQFNLNVLFGSEVCEESALRHSNLIGQNTKGNAAKTRLAHESQPLMQYPVAG